MRWMSVLMLAGGIVTALETGLPGGANLWANDPAKVQQAFDNLNAALAEIGQLKAEKATLERQLREMTDERDAAKTALKAAKTVLVKSIKDSNDAKSLIQALQDALEKLKPQIEAAISNKPAATPESKAVPPTDGKDSPEGQAAMEEKAPAEEDEAPAKPCPNASSTPQNAPTVASSPVPAKEVKKIVFHNRAGFLCGRGGMPVSPGGRPPVLVYPDMTIEFDSNGAYSVTFAVETPRTDVTLNLELTVPFVAPVGQLRPCNEWRMVEEVPGPTAGGPPMALYEARVTVPPIHLVADRDDQKSGTVQYHSRKTWATGTSAGLALAYGCHSGSETLHIPSSPYPLLGAVGMPVASRSGTASVGTVVK